MSRSNRIWIVLLLAAAPRLVGLGAPPIGHHGWRQADTAAVARNFHHGGYRLLYPEVDWQTPGHVEMELPLYPWVVSLGYALVGERIWLARATAAAASLVTTYLLFVLVRRHLGSAEALWAALLWAFLPLTIFFGRAIMPESWMIAASVAAVCCFSRWSDDGRWGPLLASAVLVSLASLLKPTALHLGLPLLWLARHRLRSSLRARIQLAVFSTAVALPVAAWYLHAHRLGTASGATFGILSGSGGKAGSWDLLLAPDFYHRVFLEFFAGRLVTWVGLLLLLLGLVLPRATSRERLFDWWLGGGAIVLLLAAGGSYHHEYYGLPLVVPAVAHMGRGLVWIQRRSLPALVVVLTAIALFSGWRLAGYWAQEDERRPRHPEVAGDLGIAAVLSRHTGPSDLIVACDQTDPTWFYLSRRRGWGRDCRTLDKRSLDELRQRGARFLVARHGDLAASAAASRFRLYLLRSHRVVHDNGDAFLVELTARPSSAWPATRRWRADRAAGTLPSDWRLSRGRWRASEGSLVLEPARRQLAIAFPPPSQPCGPCGLRLILAVEPAGPDDRRRVLTVSGWRSGRSSTDAVLDLTSGRATLARTEGAATPTATATRLPRLAKGPLSIELDFDGYDFRLALGAAPLLTLPAADPERVAGDFGLSARNLRVRLDELTIFAPEQP